MPAKKKKKTVSLDTMIDKHVGKTGTHGRDAFEYKLKIAKVNFKVGIPKRKIKIA